MAFTDLESDIAEMFAGYEGTARMVDAFMNHDLWRRNRRRETRSTRRVREPKSAGAARSRRWRALRRQGRPDLRYRMSTSVAAVLQLLTARNQRTCSCAVCRPANTVPRSRKRREFIGPKLCKCRNCVATRRAA